MKALFHNGAMSAIQHCKELKEYRAANRYQRKVSEGKNEMLVINNVCNKLVHRIFACISRREKYNENYIQTFAWIIEIGPLKAKRNPIEFACKKAEIEPLKVLANQDYLEVFYYDESHFSLTSCVPYAWQIKDETIEIPTARSKNINVAGFFSKKKQLIHYCSQTSINSEN